MKNIDMKSKMKPVQLPTDISKTPLRVEKNIKMLQGQADPSMVKKIASYIKTFGRKD